MQCDRCGGEQVTKAGRDRQRRQLYRYRVRDRRLTERFAPPPLPRRRPGTASPMTSSPLPFVGIYTTCGTYHAHPHVVNVSMCDIQKGGWAT